MFNRTKLNISAGARRSLEIVNNSSQELSPSDRSCNPKSAHFAEASRISAGVSRHLFDGHGVF